MIDPSAITFIQNTLLQQMSLGFVVTLKYAHRLFYFFSAFELVLFGMMSSLSAGGSYGAIFLKILKISFIFFILQEYSYLINILFKSFTQIAGEVGNKEIISTYITNPALLWQYAYDSSFFLLRNAMNSTNIGLILLQLSLGLSMLIVFALLGIQILLYYVGFYFVAFVTLIMIPVAALSTNKGILNKAIYTILQAAIRLMVLMIIIAVAVTFWLHFNLDTQSLSATDSLNSILGLLFSAMIFLGLSRYLPNLAARTIDSIIAQPHTNVLTQPASPTLMMNKETYPVIHPMQAATQISVKNSMLSEMSGAAAASVLTHAHFESKPQMNTTVGNYHQAQVASAISGGGWKAPNSNTQTSLLYADILKGKNLEKNIKVLNQNILKTLSNKTPTK